MKKIISVILCVILIFTSVYTFAFADYTRNDVKFNGEVSDYPVIIVGGYGGPALRRADTKEHVWGIDIDLIISRVLANIAQIGIGLGGVAFGKSEYIAKVVGEEFDAMFENMRCNPDGSSTYPIENYFSTAETASHVAMLKNYPNGEFVPHEIDISNEMAEYIGMEKLYSFNCDFRMGAEACAKQLDEFIQDVKQHSGKDKVNIYALSHGGQVSATYFCLYGEKMDVDNACLTVPAIGGAGFALDMMAGDIHLDEENLIRFIENGTMAEEDFNWLVKAQQLGFLDEVCNNLIPYLEVIMGNWGSIWDFAPTEDYEELKAKKLDPVANKELIAKSDRYHYEILPTVGENLQKCIDRGMNISIIAGTGNDIVTGCQRNSDGIILTNGATGATCAPYQNRFANGYKQVNDCGGKYKISPANDIDASTGYLPDNTWYVDGLFHGMTYWDHYTRTLLMKLVLTDEITDVYSDHDFPQFKYSTNASHGVYFEFDKSVSGYVNDDDTALVIKNCFNNSNAKIAGIYVDGADLSFKLKNNKTLKPQESITIPIDSASFNKGTKQVFSITVSYTTNNLSTLGYRTETFTYGIENQGDGTGLVSLAPSTPLDSFLGGFIAKFFDKLGLSQFILMIYTCLQQIGVNFKKA